MKETIYPFPIYHIAKKNSDPLFIYGSFSPQALKQINNSHIEIRFGKDIDVEKMGRFRESVYSKVEKSSEAWIADASFYSRFFNSTLVFIVLVLVLTFLIRDPIPLADEALIGLVGALFFNKYLLSRNKKSVKAIRRRLALRTKIEGMRFAVSSLVNSLENILEKAEGLKTEDLISALPSYAESIPNTLRNEVEEFLFALENGAEDKKMQKKAKLLLKKGVLSKSASLFQNCGEENRSKLILLFTTEMFLKKIKDSEN